LCLTNPECIISFHLAACPRVLSRYMHFCISQTASRSQDQCGRIGHFPWSATAVLSLLLSRAVGFLSPVLTAMLQRWHSLHRSRRIIAFTALYHFRPPNLMWPGCSPAEHVCIGDLIYINVLNWISYHRSNLCISSSL
jgi:hypothetical protein